MGPRGRSSVRFSDARPSEGGLGVCLGVFFFCRVFVPVSAARSAIFSAHTYVFGGPVPLYGGAGVSRIPVSVNRLRHTV